jgi:hypothetical protein
MLHVFGFFASLLASTPPPPAPAASLEVPAATDEDRRSFRQDRAALELGVAMGLGIAWYESQIELNKLDFDFDRTWKDQTRRLFTSDGYRFDDNNLTLNVGHAFMGAYYHQFARQNGGGMLEALLFDFVTSSVWELTVEHREVISLNDTVVTTLGGVSIGESLYQIGDYFGRSEPTLRNRLLMGLFSPAHAAGWLFGDRPRPSAAGFDDRGLARDAHHRFALGLGAARPLGASSAGEAPAWDSELRADLELLSLPSYGRPGSRQRWLEGGEMSRIAVDYRGSRQDLQALSISTRSSLWGHYRQETQAGADGGLRGSARFLGTATAFELLVEDLGTFNDFLSSMHLPGPSADLTWHRDHLALRLVSDLTPDFAMVRPFALDHQRTPPELHGHKSTIPTHRYYYALGVASATRLEASYRRARAGASVEWTHHDSIEGLDRHQVAYTSPTGVYHEAISNDANAVDQRLKMRVYADSALPLTDLRLGLSLDYRQRSGSLGPARREHEDTRLSLLASYAL